MADVLIDIVNGCAAEPDTSRRERPIAAAESGLAVGATFFTVSVNVVVAVPPWPSSAACS